MEPMIYDNHVVREHSLYARCPSTLNEISNRDYPGTDYFNPDIIGLDMDDYERRTCHGHANNTVDAVIGICTCQNKKKSSPRLLLVELRMGYEKANNLSKSEMERKILHTKELLSAEKTINRESVFIFDERVAAQARHWFAQRSAEGGGELRHIVVYSVKDFNRAVLSYDDMPYTPINSPEHIQKSLKELADQEQWPSFFEKVCFWFKKAEQYRYTMPFEYKSIKEAVSQVWSTFRANSKLKEDDELYAQIIEEDFFKK